MSPRFAIVSALGGNEIEIDLDDVLYFQREPDGTLCLVMAENRVLLVANEWEDVLSRAGIRRR